MFQFFVSGYIIVLIKNAQQQKLTESEQAYLDIFMDNSSPVKSNKNSKFCIKDIELDLIKNLFQIFRKLSFHFSDIIDCFTNNIFQSNILNFDFIDKSLVLKTETRECFLESKFLPIFFNHQISTFDFGVFERLNHPNLINLNHPHFDNFHLFCLNYNSRNTHESQTDSLFKILSLFLFSQNSNSTERKSALNKIKIIVKTYHVISKQKSIKSSKITQQDNDKENAPSNFSFESNQTSEIKKELENQIFKQTFPSEVFKKSSMTFSKLESPNIDQNKQRTVQVEKIAKVQRSICFEKPNSSFKNEKTRQIKFPSPEKTEKLVRFSGKEEFKKVESWGLLKLVDEKQKNQMPIDANLKSKFYNSKNPQNLRKMTETNRDTVSSNNLVMSVGVTGKEKAFFKESVVDYDENLKKSENLKLEKSNESSSVSDFKQSFSFSTLSSLSFQKSASFKIEKIVSKNSISSTFESLVGTAVKEFIQDMDKATIKLNPDRLVIKNSIQTFLNNNFPKDSCELSEYGSFVTGLMTPFSDMDLSIKSKLL